MYQVPGGLISIFPVSGSPDLRICLLCSILCPNSILYQLSEITVLEPLHVPSICFLDLNHTSALVPRFTMPGPWNDTAERKLLLCLLANPGLKGDWEFLADKLGENFTTEAIR